MLQLGDVLIHEKEVVSVTWRGDRLRLVLRWELEEVPVLLELPREVSGDSREARWMALRGRGHSV